MVKFIKCKRIALQLLLVFFVFGAFYIVLTKKTPSLSRPDTSLNVEAKPLNTEAINLAFNIKYRNELATCTMIFSFALSITDKEATNKFDVKKNDVLVELKKRLPPIVEHYVSSADCYHGMLNQDMKKIANDVISEGQEKELIKKVSIQEFLIK